MDQKFSMNDTQKTATASQYQDLLSLRYHQLITYKCIALHILSLSLDWCVFPKVQWPHHLCSSASESQEHSVEAKSLYHTYIFVRPPRIRRCSLRSASHNVLVHHIQRTQIGERWVGELRGLTMGWAGMAIASVSRLGIARSESKCFMMNQIGGQISWRHVLFWPNSFESIHEVEYSVTFDSARGNKSCYIL